MRIENLMKCAMFFPYAGLKDDRGWELKPNQISENLPATRFFNPLLQRDWKAGHIKIYVNEQDNKIISADCMIDKKDNSLIAPAKLAEATTPTPKAVEAVSLQEDTNVDTIPLVSKEPIRATKVNLNEYTEKMNKVGVHDKVIKDLTPSSIDLPGSLNDLNSQKTGVPNLEQNKSKSKMDEISSFMKGPIG